MAILDRQNTFSYGQVVTATANSTDVIDLGPSSPGRNIGHGEPVRIVVDCRTVFAGGTSLRVQFVESAASNLSSPVTLADSGVIAVASLTAGRVLIDGYVPATTGLRYQGLIFTVVGTMTGGGAIDGFLALDTDHQVQYTDGYTVNV